MTHHPKAVQRGLIACRELAAARRRMRENRPRTDSGQSAGNLVQAIARVHALCLANILGFDRWQATTTAVQIQASTPFGQPEIG